MPVSYPDIWYFIYAFSYCKWNCPAFNTVKMERQRNWATIKCRKQIFPPTLHPLPACLRHVCWNCHSFSALWHRVSVMQLCGCCMQFSVQVNPLDSWQGCSYFPVLELWLPVIHLSLFLGYGTVLGAAQFFAMRWNSAGSRIWAN